MSFDPENIRVVSVVKHDQLHPMLRHVILQTHIAADATHELFDVLRARVTTTTEDRTDIVVPQDVRTPYDELHDIVAETIRKYGLVAVRHSQLDETGTLAQHRYHEVMAHHELTH